jgi:hypothetical protein
MLVKGTNHPRHRLELSAAVLLGVVASLAALWLALGSSQASAGAAAQTSAVKNLDEILSMRIKKVKGKQVSAKGRAIGTVAGKGSFNLLLSSGSSASATFSGHNSHGTISGNGVADYRVAGAISYYSGKITSLQGTGRYARASSRGIRFSGTVNRRTYQVKMHLRGRWHV